jgi:hypothetical protein
MTPRQASLEAAYRAAVYRVDAPEGPFILRAGQSSPEADALLRRHGHACWAYLTACNPGSVILSSEENLARSAQLRERLAGWPFLEGEGSAPDGSWPGEKSFLVLGIDEPVAHALARGFHQAAFLAGRLGEPARLLWTA